LPWAAFNPKSTIENRQSKIRWRFPVPSIPHFCFLFSAFTRFRFRRRVVSIGQSANTSPAKSIGRLDDSKINEIYIAIPVSIGGQATGAAAR
jgi:hypothetical protein